MKIATIVALCRQLVGISPGSQVKNQLNAGGSHRLSRRAATGIMWIAVYELELLAYVGYGSVNTADNNARRRVYNRYQTANVWSGLWAVYTTIATDARDRTVKIGQLVNDTK